VKDSPLSITLPPELLDALTARVEQLLEERASERREDEPWMRVEQAATYLACPRSRIYALASARRIPHRKDGSRLLFRPSELDAWLDLGGGKRP
jgi:excisionase family DNA binding protein